MACGEFIEISAQLVGPISSSFSSFKELSG
jgi:hypothetical protein